MTIVPRDVRVWLCWGLAAMVPPLVMRNPIVLMEIFIIVLTVRSSCVPPERLGGWRWFVRIATIMLAIGVLFNVLTVHSGDRVLVNVPHSWPLIGGDLTLNALAFGVISAFAFFVLLLVGTTVAALLQWAELLRIVPARLAPIAVAGSVAWAFMPQLGVAVREIRETHLARGRHIHGAYQMLPLVVPLLAGSLERALTAAEALEARGFGASNVGGSGDAAQRNVAASRGGLALLISLVSLLVASYGIAVGMVTMGLGMAVVGAGLLGLGFRWRPAQAIVKTRYRVHLWTWRDSVLIAASVIALGGFIWRWIAVPGSLQFEVYPSLEWTAVDLPVMVALAFLIAPAVLLEWKEEYR